MKNLISFITLLIFVHTTAYHMNSTEAKDGLPDPVLDEDGNVVVNNNIYHVLPSMPGRGGLTANPMMPFQNCTFGVTQLPHGDGLALGFLQLVTSPAVAGDPILESTDLNLLMFSNRAGCVSSAVLKVDEYDESTGQFFIVTGASIGNPGSQTLKNWFKIEKVDEDNHYKFVFKPSVCPSCIRMCSDIGFVRYGGVELLALSETPFIFKFRKFSGELDGVVKFRKLVGELDGGSVA